MLPDGRWFDAEQAESWQHEDADESGSVVRREVLWITRKEAFVLESWRPGTFLEEETLVDRSYVTDLEAVSWFLTRGMDVPEPLARLRDELET